MYIEDKWKNMTKNKVTTTPPESPGGTARTPTLGPRLVIVIPKHSGALTYRMQVDTTKYKIEQEKYNKYGQVV